LTSSGVPGAARLSVATVDSLSWAARSCSVRNSLPANLAGRCRGVVVALDQDPCRSGSPQGVCHCLVLPGVAFATAGVWAIAADAASNRIDITKIRLRTINLLTCRSAYGDARRPALRKTAHI